MNRGDQRYERDWSEEDRRDLRDESGNPRGRWQGRRYGAPGGGGGGNGGPGASGGGYGGRGSYGNRGYGGMGRGGSPRGYGGAGGYGGSDNSTGGYPGAQYGESGFGSGPASRYRHEGHEGGGDAEWYRRRAREQGEHQGEHLHDEFSDTGYGGYRSHGSGPERQTRWASPDRPVERSGGGYYGSPSGEGGGYQANYSGQGGNGPVRTLARPPGERDWRARTASDEESGMGYGGEGPYEQPAWAQHAPRRAGPKGYVRSDERIREEVCERLSRSGRLDVSDVEVKVDQGIVTLTGTVPNRQQKYLLEDVADDVLGVQDVHNQVRIHRDWPSTPSWLGGEGGTGNGGSTPTAK